MATMASFSNTERGSSSMNGIPINATSSPSQVASTSVVTLDQKPANSVKEEDEDAKLFASLVNGIQSGAVTTSDPSASSNQENADSTAAWANAISNLQNVTGGTFPSLDLMQPMSNNLSGLEGPSSFSHPPSISNDAEMNMPPEPIAAYAKLEFPGFSYYIQTLDFTIGRRPAEFRSQTSLQQHITGSSKSLGDVDVDLGPLKSISRFHVRIFYQDQPAPPPRWATGHDPNFSGNIPDNNGSMRSRSSFDEDAMSSFAPQGRFVLQVLGRNGCCVDDVYVGKGAIVPLGKRTKIQIAERVFYFVLPPSHSLLMSMDDDEEEESIGSSAEEESEEEEDLQEESSSGSLGGSSEEESESETLPASVKKKKLVLKKNAKAIPSGKGGKGKGKDDEIEDAMEEEDEESGKQSNANRKRKRGEPSEEEEKVLKVGTPIGVEALSFNKKKKKSNNPSGLEGTPSTSPEFLAGKGKGGGKSAIVSAAMAKARADVEAIQAAAEAQAAAVAALQSPSTNNAGDASMTSQQGSTSISATPASPILDKNKKPLPPAGPGIKPDKSNMDLIREAMNGPLSVSRGGKMALQEIYEYLTSTYEWFRNNSRANGRDWHSAIRHAVGNARDMDRIPRKPHESGKGVFYAFSSSDAAKAAKAEAEAAANQSDTTNAATPTPPPSLSSNIAGLPPSAVNAGNVSGPLTGIATPLNMAKTSISTPLPASSIASPAQGGIEGANLTGPDAAVQASTTGPAPSSSSPAPPSAIAPDGRVRIVVGKAPADALAQMANAPKPAITQSIEALFGGPPIVHHEGTLFLSPIVFGAMSAEEINDIGGKGAQQALATLQAQLVAHLQSKMAAGATSPPPPSSPLPNPRPNNASASPGPGQVRPPLGNRPPPQQVHAAAQMNNVRPALARPAANTLNGRPPIQSRPPIARPTSTTSNVRPGANQSSAIGKSGAPLPVRPPTGRPPLTNIARPTTGASLSRPGRPPLQPRPAVQGPSASIARPGTAIGGQIRPVQGTAISNGSTARPLGANTTARPVATTAARPTLPRPSSGVSGSNVSTNARPAISRPPLHNAQRPIGSTGSTPTAGQNTGVSSVRPSLARPIAGRPPLSARPRPALPGQQVGRPPSTAISGNTQVGSIRPNVSTGIASGNTTIRPTSSASTSVRPITGSPSGSVTSGSNPSVTATPSTPIAGSSQSDMAALLALLTGGKLDSSKLTPAQHELLQRAGRLAAEQQKAQQQKVAAAVTAGSARSPSPIKTAVQSPVARPIGSVSQNTQTRTPLTPKAATPTTDNAQPLPIVAIAQESESAIDQPSTTTSNGENKDAT